MDTKASATASGPFEAGQPPFFELSRLMVVAIEASTSKLVFKAQTAPNGPWADQWGQVDTGHAYSLMAAGITRDGRVAVAAQAAGNGPVFYIDEMLDQSPGVESWNPPVDIGMPAGVGTIQSLAMERDADGRVEIFAVAAQGTIWWQYQNPDQIVERQVTITPPGTDTPIVVTVQEKVPPATPWSGWIQLPGGLASISASRQGDGRIVLFGINAQLNLYRSQQQGPQPKAAGDWSAWVQMDTPASGGIAGVSPVVGPLGALNLFALTSRGQVIHSRQKPAGTDNWTAWATPGYSRSGVTTLAAGIQGDGDIVLVASDQAKVNCFNAQWDAVTQNWSGWRDFSSTDWPTQLMLNYNADGRVSVFSHWMLPPNVGVGGLWTLSQVAIDSSEWEIWWTQLAPGGIRQFAVVRDLTPPAS